MEYIISNDEFQKELNEENIVSLDQKSHKAWEILTETDGDISDNTLRRNLPAFVSCYSNMIYVKFPTYQIEIPEQLKDDNNENKLIKNELNRIFREGKIIFLSGGTIPTYKLSSKGIFGYVYNSIIIQCAGNDIAENAEIIRNVQNLLDRHGYKLDRSIAYLYRGIPVEYLNDDKDIVRVKK